jgi:hypothetical protein
MVPLLARWPPTLVDTGHGSPGMVPRGTVSISCTASHHQAARGRSPLPLPPTSEVSQRPLAAALIWAVRAGFVSSSAHTLVGVHQTFHVEHLMHTELPRSCPGRARSRRAASSRPRPIVRAGWPRSHLVVAGEVDRARSGKTDTSSPKWSVHAERGTGAFLRRGRHWPSFSHPAGAEAIQVPRGT